MILHFIGIQKKFSNKKEINEEIIDFHINFFNRIKEIKANKGISRYLRYDSTKTGHHIFIFIGLEVQEITEIPNGMVSWTMTDKTLKIQEQKDDKIIPLSEKEISWIWINTSSFRVTGEFFIPGSDGINPNTPENFFLSANAYTDLNGEIEDGDRVNIVEYDPSWPDQYAQFVYWLKQNLGPDIALNTEHFGSTAIPGIPAKPIIDILVEIPSFPEARQRAIPLLNNEAWEYWWTDEHMMFIKRYKFMGKRTHHIHMAPRGHRLWDRLAFRDYLRTHTKDALNYAELKKKLSIQYKNDRERYTIAKGDFINKITLKALKDI